MTSETHYSVVCSSFAKLKQCHAGLNALGISKRGERRSLWVRSEALCARQKRVALGRVDRVINASH
jgi:hypothetical protein